MKHCSKVSKKNRNKPPVLARRGEIPSAPSFIAKALGKRWTILSVFVLLTGAALWTFMARQARSMADTAQARLEGRPLPVRTAYVEERDFDDVIGATAVTMPSFASVIRIPPTGGLSVRYVPPVTDMVIKTVHIHEGDYVQKDQLLFETDNEFFKQVLEQRKSAVAAAEAQVTRGRRALSYNKEVREREVAEAEEEVKFREADYINNRTVFEITSKLKQINGVGAVEFYRDKSLWDAAVFQREAAKRRLEKAKAAVQFDPLMDQENLARYIRELDLAKVDCEETIHGVKRSEIRSPIDGFIDGKIDIVPGQTVEVTTPLAKVLQLDPIYLRLDVPQERSDDVALGQEAEVVLDSFPDEMFRGTVSRISAHVNQQLRVFPVIVKLDNHNFRIRSGVSGFARLRKAKKAKVVPVTALMQLDKKAMVFRVEKGRARLLQVRTGHMVDTSNQEVTGLDRGDEVVVYSNFYRHWGNITRLDAYLQDNDAVDADWRKWARRN